jgi:chromosomal replication initiation ATPase DnaA
MATTHDVKLQVLAALSRSSRRPLAIVGKTGAGKTTILRSVAREAVSSPIWWSAEDLLHGLVEAAWEKRYGALEDEIACDRRPYFIEHMEDLRERPATRAEFEWLFRRRAESGGPTVVSVTVARGSDEVVDWLQGCAEVIALEQ